MPEEEVGENRKRKTLCQGFHPDHASSLVGGNDKLNNNLESPFIHLYMKMNSEFMLRMADCILLVQLRIRGQGKDCENVRNESYTQEGGGKLKNF